MSTIKILDEKYVHSDYSTNFFLWSSRTRVDLLSYESIPTYKREQYDWMAGKKIGREDHLILTILFSNQVRACWELSRVVNRVRSSFLSTIFSLSRPKKIPPSCRIALVYQSVCSCTIADQLNSEKKLVELFYIRHCVLLLWSGTDCCCPIYSLFMISNSCHVVD